jgi:hypothetical protein
MVARIERNESMDTRPWMSAEAGIAPVH